MPGFIRRLLCLLLFTVPAVADAGGYVFRDGYYWQGNVAFVQVRQCVNGRWCQVYQRHHVDQSQAVLQQQSSAYQQQVITSQDADWRSQLLELKRQQLEQEEFERSVQALGLGPGNTAAVRAPVAAALQGGYGYQVQAVTKSTPIAAQGSTVYGYTAPLVDSQAELRVLLNQLANATEKAQDLSGEAVDNLASVVAQTSQGVQEAELIRAKGDVLALLLQHLAEAKETTVNITPVVPDGGSGSGAGGDLSQLELQAQAVLNRSCVECHAADSDSGLNLEDLASLSKSDRWNIVKRITASGEGHMPPKDRPALQLSIQEIGTLMHAYEAAKDQR